MELNLNVKNETRDCCVGESFSILEYTFTLARYSHYYELSMAMTLTLVVVSFIILLMEPSNVSRTSTAVFIPLTILALQLTISDKVPVVGYFTLIDKFFVCCFVTSMVCSIESGIIYSLITTDSSWVYKFFRRFINVERLKQEDKNKDLVNNDNDDNNQSNDNTSNQEELVELQNMNTRSNSYNNAFYRNNNNDKNNSDVIKIANYDDKIINLSYEDRLIYFEIYKYIQFIDNTMRILIPIVFFSYIGHLYSFKN